MELRNVVRLSTALAFLCAAAIAQTAEQGLASWYGGSFDGQRAASGETFHQDQLTAAHRTLPFGTTVRIRRTDTGASVIVRINDRGPYVDSRIVDLSNAAARQLHMLEPGVVPVALEIVEAAALAQGATPMVIPAVAQSDARMVYAVQAGTFRVLANAERTRALLERQYGSARIVPKSDGELYCVLVGSAPAQQDAEALAAEVRKAKGLASAYVVRMDPASLPVSE
jgi:rare lipoprotein A